MNSQLIFSIVNAVPYVIAGIQQIHGDTLAGASKQLLALEALGLAGGVASTFFTGQNQQTAASVTNLVGATINAWVETFKEQSLFGFKPSAPAATPAPAPAAS